MSIGWPTHTTTSGKRDSAAPSAWQAILSFTYHAVRFTLVFMRVALAQINPTIGDFSGTCEKIVRAAMQARTEGAELTVFPELCLTGYPPRALLEKPAFLDAQDRALDRIKKALKGFPTILGCVTRRFDGVGNLLYNSCVVLLDGETLAVGRKCLLPTYDSFDENRYFEPAEKPTVVELLGFRWGLTICEDMWNDKDFWRHRVYEKDPVAECVQAGAQVLVNVSASPWNLGKQAVKEALLSSMARKHRTPLLYVNQTGSNDDLIFDGRSMAFNQQGKLYARAPAFEEAVMVCDIEALAGASSHRLTEEDEIRKALVLGVRDYSNKCGFDGAVLGLSGGIDSALAATVAAEALGADNVLGVAMPSRFSKNESLADARALAENLGVAFHVLPIENPYGHLRELLAPVFAGRAEDTSEENIQARLRGLLLLSLSNKFGRLVLTTGNKSELATGHCTLLGDMYGGLAVLGDLYKTTVYHMAQHFNRVALDKGKKPPIPERSLSRTPSAELKLNQTDQDRLPPYAILDGILKAYVENRKSLEQIVALGFEFETVKRTLRMVDFNEYKRRQAAPNLRLTIKTLGLGHRLPIAQRFREGE